MIRQFDELLKRCGDDAYEEREAASAELAAMGEAIRPLLLRVAHAPPADREVLHRVTVVLNALAPDHDAALAMAAARQTALHKPAEALAVLLDYVPFAPDDLVRQEVQLALNALATDAAHQRVLIAAIKRADPLQRAAAGEALARATGKTLASPLLRDPHPRVRLQVALALAEGGERDAVPVLIELLAVLPPESAWLAQDCLLRLVEDDAPLPVLGGTLPPRKVAGDWKQWWKTRGAQVDVARLLGKPGESKHLLLTHAGTKGLNNATLVELDADKQPIWKIEGLRYPLDVQVIGKQRVLITEYLGRRVTERDFKGNVLWEKAATLPLAAQRLPGGRTFIACRQQLLVVDRHGREVFTYRQVGPSIVAAQRLRDGYTVIACAGGICHILDPEGRERKSFRVGQLYTMGSNIDVLPGGRILVPLYSENLVAEYDFDGNQLWKAKVMRPTSAIRLPSGNTLVVSQLQNRVAEIDPTGKEVWSYTTPGRPWRARWR